MSVKIKYDIPLETKTNRKYSYVILADSYELHQQFASLGLFISFGQVSTAILLMDNRPINMAQNMQRLVLFYVMHTQSAVSLIQVIYTINYLVHRIFCSMISGLNFVQRIRFLFHIHCASVNFQHTSFFSFLLFSEWLNEIQK